MCAIRICCFQRSLKKWKAQATFLKYTEPAINNNDRCSSSTEVAGVITTACYKETANEIDILEDDKYNDIEHDTDVLNNPECKPDNVNFFVDASYNELVIPSKCMMQTHSSHYLLKKWNKTVHILKIQM